MNNDEYDFSKCNDPEFAESYYRYLQRLLEECKKRDKIFENLIKKSVDNNKKE